MTETNKFNDVDSNDAEVEVEPDVEGVDDLVLAENRECQQCLPDEPAVVAPKAEMLVGQNVVIEPFGKGIVLEFRAVDGIYAIKLLGRESYQGVGVLYTREVPEIDDDQTMQEQRQQQQEQKTVDELNVALEKLEKMRTLNFELECNEVGIYDVDHSMCTCCLKERGGSSAERSHFPRLQKFIDGTAEMDIHQSFTKFNGLFGTYNSTTEGGSNGAWASAAPTDQYEDTTTQTDVTCSTSVAPNESEGSTQNEAPLSQFEQSPNSRGPPGNTMGRSSEIPQPTTSFPRLYKFWGTIQKVPHPAQTTNSEHNGTITTTKTPPAEGHGSEGRMQSTSVTESTATAAASTSKSFPRIRGLVNSTSMTSSIFFGNVGLSSGNTKAAVPSVFGLAQSTQDTNTNSSQHSTSSTPSTASRLANGPAGKPKALPRIQKLIDQRERAQTLPCLICASPSCPKHSSSSFRREGITLCLSCERLFELDFIVDCVSQDPSERSKSIDHIIDCYDRCILMLRYSTRFIEPIAQSLEEQKEQQNKIGLGSSSVGVLSGVLGIAAAASILTPAGPPLLIASLFFGGGATAVQTGSEAINYFSEPRKVADRIIALHGMALSLLRVTSTLRDAILRDHIRTDVYEAEAAPAPLSEQMNETIQKNRVAVLAGSNVGRTLTLGGVAGAEAGAAASAAAAVTVAGAEGTAAGAAVAGAGAARSATAFSRAGTAVARTVRFARFAGGALSAAVLVMEANAIQKTLTEISNGNPCHKADTLRRVADEIEGFPTTSELDDECRAYLDAMESRPQPPVATDVVALSKDHMESITYIPEAPCQPADQQLCVRGATILEGDTTPSDGISASRTIPSAEAVAIEPANNSSLSSSALFLSVSASIMGSDWGNGNESGRSSLLQRFQARQEVRQVDRALGRDEAMTSVSESNGDAARHHSRTEINLVL